MTDIEAFIRALRGPILVTGASGFVGANLFQMIARQRSDVFAVVQREKNWRLQDVRDHQILAADLNDENAVKNLLDGVQPQTVFDCVAYGAYSFEKNASLIYETNFLATTRLVGMLASRPLAAFVHAGSSSEYGINSAAPRETDACKPNSDYAVSKVAASDYLSYMGKHHQFPCVNLRLYSVYGPLEDTSRLMPNLVKEMLSKRLPPLVDPEISRDFIFIDDVCHAFILAAAKMNPSIFGESLNIGSGIKTTIGQLVETARTTFGVTATPVYNSMEARAWDLQDWYSNSEKADQMLGWKAKTSLESGLIKIAEWIATLPEEEMSNTTKRATLNRRRSVTAIIACYKDAEAIPIMYRRLTDVFRRLKIDYEIIFVNDCSPDETADVILKISAQDKNVLGISHSRNFGSQMAFRSGMELSTKQAVVLLDGDLQDPPELIEDFYSKWEQGHDVVYGRRVQREMPWIWGLLYKAFYRVFAAFSYVKIPLDAGDFSLIDQRVVGWLLRSPERDLFMRGLRAYVGFRQTGVDYIRPERQFGRSTNNLLKNIDWAKKGIFSFSNVPMSMLTATGVVLFALSILAVILVVLARALFPDIAPRGITTLLISVLFFGSLNLLAIGLVGEYVAKIMTEVKDRPRLIRSALIRNGKTTQLQSDGTIV
ncbi:MULTISPECIES: NAD-dependent epimerase/dehydratase family protein [Agrobacterium]|uniref:NAD-dependent epimerase/dehydratase family protein n=1 Tax=Agrobacterium TaxID=357 RepID=UPI001E470DE2|nr:MULTISPECIES: NAD-dependent epimerase/dehydratase family protein [Agrobacterium]UHS58231.1 NAD-dependent epimerase/dehydratase family protein [Agrobacterium vaccinii]